MNYKSTTVLAIALATLGAASATAWSDLAAQPAACATAPLASTPSSPSARVTAALPPPQLAFPPRPAVADGAAPATTAAVAGSTASQSNSAAPAPTPAPVAADQSAGVPSADGSMAVSDNIIHFTNNAGDPNWPFGNRGDTGFGKHDDSAGSPVAAPEVIHFTNVSITTAAPSDTDRHATEVATPDSNGDEQQAQSTEMNAMPGLIVIGPGRNATSAGGLAPVPGKIALDLLPQRHADPTSILTVAGTVLDATDYGTPQFEAFIEQHIFTVTLSPTAVVHIDGHMASVHDLVNKMTIKLTGLFGGSGFIADSIDAHS